MNARHRRIFTPDSVRSQVGTKFANFLIGVFFVLCTAGIAAGQTLHVNYVCNGERINIESCNIRDLSDNANCMVGHPDHVMPNGLMKYTNETRGSLKKLLPTCKQPSAEQIARAQAFEKKQQDLYNANEQKAMAQLQPATQPGGGGAPGLAAAQKPKTPEERAMARCITSGRLPASCTGNSLLGAFSQMVSQVLPGADKEAATAAAAGPNMAGVFQGAGNWRLDFIDGGVLVNCSFLSPDQHSYSIDFKNDRTALVIDTTPKPLVLTFKSDGTIVGPGPLVIDGVVAGGSSGGGASDTSYSHGYKDQNGLSISDGQAARNPGQVYDRTGNRVYQPEASSGGGQATFSHKRATCPALNLSSKGASVGVQTMQTDLLKTMFGGVKGAPTPPGIRMHGIFAAPTGFSVQFFPESAILGCGPDAARAYPYTVVPEGTKAVIQIAAPDHPLKLAFNADGSLDPGSAEPYQVHGRIVTGQDQNDDFTFAPMEQSCNLAHLAPSKTIPSAGGSAASITTSAGARGNAAGNSVSNNGGNLSTPNAPLGNAVLTVLSGFPTPAGVMNPLAGRPYVLLRDDYDTALRKGGLTIPAGMMGQRYVGSICATRTPVCQQAMTAINTSAASAVRADASGKGVMPGVPPGAYYLMISTVYNKQSLLWGFKVELKAGVNTITLDQRNAAPMN